MKAYSAILKDSFREALSSRVLWVILILITLMFAAFAPFGFKKVLTYRIEPDRLRRLHDLAVRLAQEPTVEQSSTTESADEEPADKDGVPKEDPSEETEPDAPADFLRTHLTESVLSEFTDLAKEGRSRRIRFHVQSKIARELTRIIEEVEFYDDKNQAIWQDELSEEGQLLRQNLGRLSQQEKRRLHRLTLEASFPLNIGSQASQSIEFTYAIWDTGFSPVVESDFKKFAVWVLGEFVKSLLSFAVFAAIIVTASIIPNTFDHGSVYLLLSKPIHRSFLYLTKFLGGCFFVLINMCYLVIGTWLLVGWRLGIWHHKLFWYIPVLLFLFIIYYSVSGFVGLIWRNSVVCIVITIVFWFLCTIVGSTKAMMDIFTHDPNRISQIQGENQVVFAMNNSGNVQRWNEDGNVWEMLPIAASTRRGPFASPSLKGFAYDAVQNRLALITAESELTIADGHKNWETRDFGSFPESIQQLVIDPEGRLLAIGSNHGYRIHAQLKEVEPKPNVFGLELPLAARFPNGETVRLNLEQRIKDKFNVAINRSKNALVFWSNGSILIWLQDESDYIFSRQQQILEEPQPAWVASEGDSIFVALSDGTIRIIDFATLESVSQFQPFGNDSPKSVAVSDDGRYVLVLSHSLELWVFDTQEAKDVSRLLKHQNDITAATFFENKLLVAHQINRIDEYDLPPVSISRTFKPEPTMAENLSRMLIDPVYFVFPKPGQLEETISYLMTGKKTVSMEPFREVDLGQSQRKTDPWAPVWSSLVFMILLLMFSCYYIRRQDY